MKKEYEALEIEIKEFQSADIMALSENPGVEEGGMGEDGFGD